jgi:hypothetical protein
MANLIRFLPADSLVTMVAAPTLWFAYFLAVYGLNALRCALGIEAQLFGTGLIELVIAALSAFTTLIMMLLGIITYRRRFGAALKLAANDGAPGEDGPLRFLAGAGLSLAFLSLVATVWVWIAAMIVPACA